MATNDTWTVLKMLEWTTGWLAEKGIDDSPRLDAELMLAHALGAKRMELYMQFDRPLADDELAHYKALIKRRAAGEPVAYIVGERGFWTIELKCDKRALVPRPETEVVVEEALEVLGEDFEARIIDIGTGTGAIGLTIARERPAVDMTLTDTSADAIALARENAEALELDVAILEGDLFAGAKGEFDMVVSNPPYVGENERDLVDDTAHEHEPHDALYAGQDGLDVIRRLVPAAKDKLKSGGWLIFEHGFRQGDAVRKLLEDAGFEDVRIRKDYSDHDRVALGRKP